MKLKQISILVFFIFLTSKLYSETAVEIYNKALSEKNITQSEKIFQNISRKYPLSSYAPKSLYKLAELNYLKGNYPESVKYYEKIIKLYPESDEYKEAFYNHCLVLYLNGDIDESKNRLQEYLKKFKNKNFNKNAIVKLGDIAYKQGNIAEAIEYYTKSVFTIKDNSYKSWIYFQLGNCYDYAKQFKEAFIAYKTVIEFFPESLEYYKSKQKINEYKKKDIKVDYETFNKNNTVLKFYVQLAAFKTKDRALNFFKELKKKFLNKYVEIIPENNYYKVIVGYFMTYNDSDKFLKDNNLEGIVKTK